MLSPNCVPDPRIGIGLCFWQMNQKPKAKAAWERALEVVRSCNDDTAPSLILRPRIPKIGLRRCYWV